MLRKILLRTLAIAVSLSGAVYTGDYLSIRFRFPGNRAAFDFVQVQRYFAVVQKDKRTSYMFTPPAPEECVNSVFPHYGDRPCWYVKTHTRERIDMDSGPAHPFIDTP